MAQLLHVAEVGKVSPLTAFPIADLVKLEGSSLSLFCCFSHLEVHLSSSADAKIGVFVCAI